METVTILWSGGWDGTFRFLQLCQYDINIQPVYVIGKTRKSYPFEIERIKKIIEIAKERFKANILDVKYYEKEWIEENCKDDKISEAFRYLREKYNVGTQYELFALLTKHLGNVKMESAVVHQYHGKVEEAITAEGVLSPVENDFLPERYCVLPSEKSTYAYEIFGNLILPVIKLTKKDEEDIARENGWLDIMKLTWFCHSPINGEPCGLCGPCDDAMNTGMEWRMPKKAQRRYRHRKFYKFIRKIKKKIKGE